MLFRSKPHFAQLALQLAGEAVFRIQPVARRQAVAKRQTEIFRQVMEESTAAMKSVMAAGSPEDKAARQTELTKEAFKRAIANMRELAEMVAKSQGEAFEVINKVDGNFTDEDQVALLELAKHAAIALENTQQRQQLLKTRSDMADLAANVAANFAPIAEERERPAARHIWAMAEREVPYEA